MTDEATNTATTMTTEEGRPTFQIVPTLDGYVELAQRVEHLEAHVPATVPDGAEPDDIDQLHERLDRHRTEIEQVKRVLNQIIRFLGSSGIPASPPAESQDTVQPQSRNLIQ